MPSKTHVQTDFSGGVVDRRVEGRTDSARYDKTMRQADNFVVTRTGTLRRRPGTVYVGDAFERGGSNPENNVSVDQDFRLVPWDTSDNKRSLLAVSKTMVSLYEDEQPGVSQLGFGTTARFIRPLKPTVDRPEDNRVFYTRMLDRRDYEKRLGETTFNSTKFKDTDLNNFKHCAIGDTCYLAPEGYPLHCCVKDSFYGTSEGNPFAPFDADNGLYNMPVAYIDGPYAAEFKGRERSQTRYGPLFMASWQPLMRQAQELQFTGDDRVPFPGTQLFSELPTSTSHEYSFSVTDANFGALAQMRLTIDRDADPLNLPYPNLFGSFEEQLAAFYSLPEETTQLDLVNTINANISCEHPCCYEDVLEDGKVRRWTFNVYGAFLVQTNGPQSGSGQIWADHWLAPDTDSYAVVDGAILPANVIVLSIRITNVEGHRSDDLGDIDNINHPYYKGAASGGSLYKANGTLKWGINVDKGIRAIHETQDRLGVVFEDDPGRLYYTRTSGFGIFVNKNGINDTDRGQLNPVTGRNSGGTVALAFQLRSRCYLDFGSGLISDTLALSASDGFDVLPDGLNGSRITHVKSMFDGVIIFTERGCALLRGGTSRQLDALSFVTRKINDDGAMRSCEPQDVESGIVYVDSTGSKLIYLEPAQQADTALKTTDISYASKALMTPDAATVGGRGTPPVATAHRSMSLVISPINQARICKSNGEVINFSIDAAGQFYAFTKFNQNPTAQYNGQFLDYAQIISKLGGYVFVANLANRSVINGLTQVGEILRETIDVDQGSPESLICMDRMAVLVETNDEPPDPDGDGDGNDTEISRLGSTLTDPANSSSTSTTQVVLSAQQAANFFNVGDEFTVSVEGPVGPEELKYLGIAFDVPTELPVPWDQLKAVCTAVVENGPTGRNAICTLKDATTGNNFTILQDAGTVFDGFDLQNNMKFTKIQDSGGGFLTGKFLAPMPHLANEVVTVNDDGIESTDTLDSLGNSGLSIADSYEKFLGLPFTSSYESMPLQRLSQLSTADDSRITLKRIYRAFVKVIRSVNGRINGKLINYDEGEAVKTNNRYDGIVEHNVNSEHKIDETLKVSTNTSNMLEMTSITYEIDSGGVS